MNEVKFFCKVITPMFMAGADRRTPELRPSEFKGMMRFWWRAIKAEDNIEDLKKQEVKLFGGTGEGEGKSKFGIRVRYNGEKLEEEYKHKDLKNDYNLKWRYNRVTNSLKGEHKGIGYLLYSVVLDREREFIKEDFPFEIIFYSFDEKVLEQILASFWSSVYLGGFGTRARRGGGNISIEKVEGNSFGINFIPRGLRTKVGLKDWLIKNIRRIKEIIPMGTICRKCRKYSNLKDASIFIFDWKSNWVEALNSIGTAFENFRQEKKSDVWRTPAFGMPVMHNNRFRERFVPYKYIEDIRLSDRRSSPLIFKVIKVESSYFPVIVRLSGDIVYDGKVGKEKKQPSKAWEFLRKEDINDTILDEFLYSLKNKEEVRIE